VESIGLRPKRVAATNGGEYKSSCPACEGTNRFIIWPKIDRYWCRRCTSNGDAIQFCRNFLKMSYFEACSHLQRDSRFKTKRDSKTSYNELKMAEFPPAFWRIKAKAFVNCCHTHLMQHQDMLDYLQDRGFKNETITKQQFGYCHNPISSNGDFYRFRSEWGLPDTQNDKGNLAKLWLPAGIVIPFHSVAGEVLKIKIRRLNWHPDNTFPKYVEVSGSSKQPSYFGTIQDSMVIVLVESEFDAILLHQEAYDLCISLALGGVSKKPDLETHSQLLNSPLLLFALDFDEAGKKVFSYWRSTYTNLRAWPAPLAKSPGDAYLKGIDLRKWIFEGIERYKK